MCNLYRLNKPADDVAAFFRNAGLGVPVVADGNVPELVYPGYPGLVAAADGLRAMVWGFPLARTGAKGQPLKPKPVNNSRSDKLGSPFWSASFRERRCLIPASAWAEAQGPMGSKTRTWLAHAEGGLLAMAGIWRSSAEWGDVFSMVMTDAAGAAARVHHRMPVILAPADWACWMGGPANEAAKLCRPWHGPLAVDDTTEPWAARR